MISLRQFALLAAALLVSGTAAAKKNKHDARARYIRANYSKFEYMIPMRDGVKLFTAVYRPNRPSKGYPIMLMRTPYRVAPYGADRYRRALGPTADFERSGYIFVLQDVRGQFKSEGKFVNMRPHNTRVRGKLVNESTDTYDTIAWLLKNVPGHNGKVGMFGTSYPGFYAAAGAINGHPALKAVSPQAPIADWFWDDVHHHGALILPLAFNFFSFFRAEGLNWPERFNFRTPDGYQFFHDLGPLSNVNKRYFKGKVPFWNAIVDHPNYDAFWQSRNLLPHLRGVRAATLVVGGWYDSEDLYGPLRIYGAINKRNRNRNHLVMGPWTHGGWHRSPGKKVADSEFGFGTSEFFQKHVEFPFFEHHLKGRANPKLPKALIFETGANRWRRFKRWPPRRVVRKQLYLGAQGRLSYRRPAADTGHDQFISDPAKPVPFSANIGTKWSKTFMGEDQRVSGWRPDVLVYQTPPLKQDVTVAGPVWAKLFVSTNKTAADWVVKLIDVQPGQLPDRGKKHVYARGGQQILVRGEVFRGRFRRSYRKPQPFVPNRVTPVSFKLLDVLHTFKRGHRIMVHIQSSWFPLVDRNPQNYVPNIYKAKATDFTRATHRVYRTRTHPTSIQLGVLQGTAR